MHGLEDAPGAYFSTRYGAVDFFVVDCRMYRPDVGDDAKRCEVDPNAPLLPQSQGPLGPTQEAWLFEGLRNSDATFKFIACGSRFTPEGSLDSWAAFPEASQRLGDFITSQNIEGVVFLSGDIHRSLFSAFPTTKYDIPEIVSSPLANATGTCGTSDPKQRACYDAGNSWVQIDIDPTQADPTLTAKILDEAGRERAAWTIKRSELQ
jgi:alkaline phosphatase D